MNKLAFFDFNGTLTKTNNSFDFLMGEKNNKFKHFVYKCFGSISIIRKLGLKIHGLYLKHKKLSIKYIEEHSLKIELKNDLFTTLNALKNLGFKIFIISGGVKQVIELALKENIFLIDDIYSNELLFNENNIVTGLKPTNCDFAHKKKIMLKLINQYNASNKKCIFVCNNFNDKSALKLPIKRFCLNKNLESLSVNYIDSLSEILNFIK